MCAYVRGVCVNGYVHHENNIDNFVCFLFVYLVCVSVNKQTVCVSHNNNNTLRVICGVYWCMCALCILSHVCVCVLVKYVCSRVYVSSLWSFLFFLCLFWFEKWYSSEKT